MSVRIWHVPLVLLFTALLHFLGLYAGIYDAQIAVGFVWWDNVLHFLVGIAFGLLWLFILQALGIKRSFAFVSVSTLLAVLMAAVGWEVFEYLARIFYRSLAESLQLYSPNLTESMTDILSDLVGAVTVLLWMKRPSLQKYAFVDRDGTILWEPERPEGVDPREAFPLMSPDEVRFTPGALEGMKKLVQQGYKLVLVTNQPFLGTSKHPKDIFDKVTQRMRDVMAKEGLKFEFEMVCPHGPDEGCDCRKPGIGGVKQFLAEHPGDLPNSLMFGDRDTDGEFAKNLGVHFVRVPTNQPFTFPS